MSVKEQAVNFGMGNEAVETAWDPSEADASTTVKTAVYAPVKKRLPDDETERKAVIIPLKKEGEASAASVKAKPAYEFFKRLFDIVISAIASIVLLVPIMVIAVIIMCKDPGVPFYAQTRVGKGGREIKILKFRTMRKNADKLENMLTQEQLEEYKREYKLDDDPRLIGYKHPGDGKTCFGARLRQLSIDELPQIVWNICIKGDMSIVGPRPIIREELERYYTPEQRKALLSVKPGLTGYWQAYARNNAKYEVGGVRQRMELYYIENMSPLLDMKIIFRTVKAVFLRSGAK